MECLRPIRACGCWGLRWCWVQDLACVYVVVPLSPVCCCCPAVSPPSSPGPAAPCAELHWNSAQTQAGHLERVGGGGGGSTRHARQGQDDEQPTTIQKACSQAPKDIFPRSAVLACHGCRGQIRSLTSLCCSTLSCAARWGQSACCAVAW
jgi:hypothetical protein